MSETVMPLSLFLLDAATSFTDIEPPAGTRALLESFDASGLVISGFRFDEIEGGTRLTMLLPPLPAAGGEILVPVPTQDWLTLVISAAHLGDRPVIEFFEPFDEAAYVELRDLRIALRLDVPLLRPAEGAAAVELAYRGGLRLSRDWGVTLSEDSGLELLPVEIGGSGIVLSARGVAADFRSDRNLPGLDALGLPDTFQGLYLRQGRVRLLLQSVFGSTAGVTVDFHDVAIGNLGVSARIRSYHELALAGDHIDPASGLVGHLLHPEWQIGLAAVEVTLDRSALQRFFVEGLLRVPPLRTVLRCNFALEPRAGGGFVTRLAVSAERPVTVDIGPGQLVLQTLQASGTLGDAGFSLEGQLAGRLLLPGFLLEIGQARLLLEHEASHDRFEVELSDVQFGALGTVPHALLVVESSVAADGERGWRVQLRTMLSWADLRARIDLGVLPDLFPLPPDDASLVAELEWAAAPATTLHLRLRAELAGVDSLWRGVPAAWRPTVDEATLDLVVDYADAAAFSGAAGGAGADRFAGEVSAALLLRLPALPDDAPWSRLLALHTGDQQGRMRVRLRAAVHRDAMGADVPVLELGIENPVALSVQLPGLLQPQPPLEAALTRVSMALQGATAVEGRFEIAGRFTLHSLTLPPEVPLAGHLQALLQGLGLGALSGDLGAVLAFEDDRCAFTLESRFDGAELALDVFDFIANLAQGIGGGERLTGSPLDMDIGFGLRGMRLAIGSLDAGAAAEQLSVEGVVGLQMGGIGAEVFLRLSDRELAVGLAEDFPIPLEMPLFPVAPADLVALADAAGTWRAGPWDAELASLQQAANADPAPPRRLREALLARRFVLQGMRAVFELLASDANRTLYQNHCTLVVGLLHGATSALHVDTKLALVLAGRRSADGSVNPNPVQFRLPFADPRNIGVGGGARLSGFGPADPLRVLEGLQLGLGLSADMLYFALDSFGAPISIPPVGRYEGGSVELTRIRFGYGYTRNSLAIELAGAVRLPDRLVQDADTTKLIGAGVRLPTHNALNFRLDLIPVTLGAVNLVVPLFAFDLDLRNPDRLALFDARRCLPEWDGLQFVVDGLYHDALRRVAFSPFFAMLPMPNLRFDGALSIGDERHGVHVVIDEMLVLFGLWTGGTPVPVPLFAETSAPYFRNLCVNFNFAGFGIHFNLQRPFPSLSPMVLFEVLGLLSDPMLPVDPRGDLARSIRITLTDGRLRAPDEVVRMFPGLAGVIDKAVRAEVNLGDAIAVMQALVRAAQDAAQALEQVGSSLEQRLRALRRHPPRLDAGALLALLPPQLRKFRVGGQLAGFEASAVLLLIDAGDADALRSEFVRRSAGAAASAVPSLEWGHATDDAGTLRGWRPQLPREPGVQVVDAGDPRQSLLRGIEFEAFDAADAALLPAPPAARTGVVLGAHVKLFTGQRLRFFGYLFDDASFALIAGANTRPLTLSVLGITVRLPLELDARLILEGRQRRGSAHGAITGLGHADWKVMPGVLRLRVGSRAQPARISMRSNGHFAVDGAVRLDLGNGGASVEGEVMVDPSQCRVRGQLQYGLAGVFECRLQLQGRVGPSPHFRFEGDGVASLFGQALAAVRARVDERSTHLSARLDTGRWRVAGVDIDARIVLALEGELDLSRREQPAFRFEGEGSVSLFGARVQGRGGVARRNRRMNAFVEGSLSWHGRRWLQGRIAAGDDGVQLDGRASFGVNLSPSNLGGIQLANLFLRLDIGAEFALDNTAGLASFELDGHWSLVAVMPGDAGQAFPLAMQSLATSGQAALEVEFVHIRNMVRLPFGGIALPKPMLTSATSSTIRFGKWDGDMAASWAGKRAKLIAGVVPWVENGSLTADQTEHKVALKTYTVGLDSENTLTLDLPAEGDFRLALVWRNGGLALRVRSGGQDWFRQL